MSEKQQKTREKALRIPEQGEIVLMRDKAGVWPALVQQVHEPKKDDEEAKVDLLAFTVLAGAYGTKPMPRCRHGVNETGCWFYHSERGE